MAYNVTITYTGPTAPVHLYAVSPICRLYTPTASYTDTAVYEGTVYDTNISGWGTIDLMEPYASTGFPYPVPLAQFKMAVITEPDETGMHTFTFTVDSYMEAYWYKEAGIALGDQGFVVNVEEAVVDVEEATAT